jgi:hypothetical protein
MRPDERAECKEIVDKFRDFHDRCQDEWYCTKTIRRPQRTSTTLSELMATPTATAFHETKKRFEMSSFMEQESTILQRMHSTSGNINGHRSPRRVSTAPEPRQSHEYHKEEAYQLAPERRAVFDFEMESMVGNEGVDVSTTPADMGSPDLAHLDRRHEAVKPRPPIKHGDSGYVSFDATADSALESTSKKRDRSEMDNAEFMAADPRKRVHT